MSFYFWDIVPYFSLLLKGLGISLLVTIVGMFVGSILGVFIFLGKNNEIKVLKIISTSFIEIIRNTPLLVQLYLLYFGLGQLGVNLSPLWAAVIGLVINNSAYMAEIFRGGISSVPKGLKEAGFSLGLSRFEVFTKIILPPAIKNTFPSLTNQFILLFLFSSVASIISLEDLMHQTLYIESTTLRTFEVLTISGVLYYTCSGVISIGMKLTERKLFKWQ